MDIIAMDTILVLTFNVFVVLQQVKKYFIC
jgi:hypothetical protein